ncbi:MAG TPA: hypothetical protein VGC16_05425 [Rhizomicrobium sp.]
MKRSIKVAVTIGALALSLSACGHSQGDRAVSGGLIGAGGGAALGAVTGLGPGAGAVLGGAVGAVGGAATSPHDVDLGRPIWR